jgi:hypothetical protein
MIPKLDECKIHIESILRISAEGIYCFLTSIERAFADACVGRGAQLDSQKKMQGITDIMRNF